MCSSCGINVNSDAMRILTQHAERKPVQKSSLSEIDLLKMFKFTWCVGYPEFQAAFAAIGIPVEEKDLPALAKYAVSGQDKQGIIMVNGKPFSFSIIDTFSKINIPNDRMQAAMQGACRVKFV